MIYAKNICLSLGRNVILDDVSFSIEAGQYVGLIGPNGAGKTSLIKTILGLYKPTSGSVEMTPGNRIGYVPQSYSLSSVVPISVFEVLRMSGIKDKKLLEKNLLKVGLQAEFLQQNFHQLSGGQKQRVIIARSLCQEPNLIIFDEPLNGVDFVTKIKI
jgi:zinc transport system ATP-binding protein